MVLPIKFRNAGLLGEFLGAPRFTALWARGFRVLPARANGQLALAFYAGDGAGAYLAEVLCEVRFVPLLDGVAREL